MQVDLHIHTTASDGCWSPKELVAHVRDANIGLFAAADHDTVAHVIPTADLAHQQGLGFLSAVEVSSAMNDSWHHILGYGINPAHPGLNQLLEENQVTLAKYNDDTLEQLVQAGYPLNLETYDSYQYDPSRGGWKSLNFVIDAGICQDARDFFDRIFTAEVRPPRPAFPHLAQVTDTIRAAGGIPILAHPGWTLRRQASFREALGVFTKFDIAGLECYASYHDDATTQACLQFCNEHDLLITGGSDCHGGFVKRELGIPVVQLDELRLGPLMERIVWGKRRE